MTNSKIDELVSKHSVLQTFRDIKSRMAAWCAKRVKEDGGVLTQLDISRFAPMSEINRQFREAALVADWDAQFDVIDNFADTEVKEKVRNILYAKLGVNWTKTEADDSIPCLKDGTILNTQNMFQGTLLFYIPKTIVLSGNIGGVFRYSRFLGNATITIDTNPLTSLGTYLLADSTIHKLVLIGNKNLNCDALLNNSQVDTLDLTQYPKFILVNSILYCRRILGFNITSLEASTRNPIQINKTLEEITLVGRLSYIANRFYPYVRANDWLGVYFKNMATIEDFAANHLMPLNSPNADAAKITRIPISKRVRTRVMEEKGWTEEETRTAIGRIFKNVGWEAEHGA